MESKSKAWKLQSKGMLVSRTEGTNLPITVRLILRFRVGVLRKSTRHRYIPSSDRATSSTRSWAGVEAVLKYALVPNAAGEDHSLAWPNWRPLTSKLWHKRRKQTSLFKHFFTRWSSSSQHGATPTRSPFVTLLSRRAQSGRWSSFGKRVWFTELHLVLVIFFSLTFYLFILFVI